MQWRVVPVLLVVLVAVASDRVADPAEPLAEEEIAGGARVPNAQGKVTAQSRFPIIVLEEPSKKEVRAFQPGQALKRKAFAVVYEPTTSETFEPAVDLMEKQLLSWKKIPGVQPPI